MTKAWSDSILKVRVSGAQSGRGRASGEHNGAHDTWGLLKLALRLAPTAVIRIILQELTTLDVRAVMRRMSSPDLLFVRQMLAASQSGTGFVHDVEHQVTNLSRIDRPVLAMYSPNDRSVPPRHALQIQRVISGSTLFEAPADSHLIWIGPHADHVWQKRLDFLRST